MEKNENAIISKIIENCTDTLLSKKWEKHLDDYHNYTREYIKHYNESLQGNTISLSLYPYMKARSEALYEQLFYAQEKSFLTETQIKRMSTIQITNSSVA